MAKIAFFDIETNGLLDKLNVVHSLVIQTESDFYSLHGNQIKEGLDILESAELVVGHNIICFDLPALKKVYRFQTNAKLYDTLNISRLIYTNMMDIDMNDDKVPGRLRGSHSLEAWGHRLGEYKGDYDKGWDEWSPEMQEYCEQDVRVTKKIYDKLLSEEYSERAIEIEHEFQKIIHIQERNGVLFDEAKAQEYASRVGHDIREEQDRFGKQLPIITRRQKIFTPKRDNRTLGYRKGAPFCKVSFDRFNPNSRQDIVSYFKSRYNWKPEILTDKNNAKLDSKVLRGLPFPEAPQFADFFDKTKVLGYLKSGPKSWLKNVKNGRIYGKVITNGAVTGRCTHNSPNVAQVPSTRAYMGTECRSLFHSGLGWMIGGDAAGLELRMLAHYLARYDGGKYAEIVAHGDVHTENQRAADLDTRDNAKTFIYAFIYGAGNEKLGSIVTGGTDSTRNKRIGKERRDLFLSKIDGLRNLIQDVKDKASDFGFVRGLDGRRLHIRSNHKALNTLLQGGGAIIMKQANINFWENCTFDCQQVLNVHDEFELVTNHKEDCEGIGQLIVDSIIQAGKDFNLRIPLDGEYKIGKNWAEVH